ncbi:helix-turn-helix domain-containing protein [Nocardiaceae bacterium NPDC056970]
MRFRKEMRERGIADSAALARAIGMDRTTTWRVLNGRGHAGPDFVDNVLHAWGLPFDELFMSANKSRRRQASVAAIAA